MKTTYTLILICACGAAALLFFATNRHQASPVSEEATAPDEVAASAAPAGPPLKAASSPVWGQPTAPATLAPAGAGAPGAAFAAVATTALNALVDTLVAPRATYEQKQGAWKQLRDSGKLDQAIQELEQRFTQEPRVAEIPAALGQAYLQKCGTLKDVREQGILAMQADKAFDSALNLDPGNWDARFTKAVAMSYWPANLGKGDEVAQHFQLLIQQQETEAPQPQFADTYLWLGSQYQKSGQNAEAQSVWQRGATLFPTHDGLRKKLAGVAVAQNPRPNP